MSILPFSVHRNIPIVSALVATAPFIGIRKIDSRTDGTLKITFLVSGHTEVSTHKLSADGMRVESWDSIDFIDYLMDKYNVDSTPMVINAIHPCLALSKALEKSYPLRKLKVSEDSVEIEVEDGEDSSYVFGPGTISPSIPFILTYPYEKRDLAGSWSTELGTIDAYGLISLFNRETPVSSRDDDIEGKSESDVIKFSDNAEEEMFDTVFGKKQSENSE